MRRNRGGLKSSLWPDRPCSVVLETPGKVLKRSWSTEASDGTTLGSVKGLSDSGTVDVDQTVVEEMEASIRVRFGE